MGEQRDLQIVERIHEEFSQPRPTRRRSARTPYFLAPSVKRVLWKLRLSCMNLVPRLRCWRNWIPSKLNVQGQNACIYWDSRSKKRPNPHCWESFSTG